MENKAVLETSHAETATIPRAEYDELLELKKNPEWLLEQLRVLKSKQFGSSSEKTSYRQEQEWNRRGVMISRQTMSNWLIRSSNDWLAPVYAELHKQLLQHDLLHIHTDETELQVLREEGRDAKAKSYMWLYRTGSDAEHPVILYEYAPGRGQEYPKAFLKDFRGYLRTDGYSGYNAVDGAIHVGCWAHARRKFDEALRAVPKGKRSPTAEQGVAYCTELFKMEEKLKELSPNERKEKRQEQVKVLAAMLA